jgi:hypothetical protein
VLDWLRNEHDTHWRLRQGNQLSTYLKPNEACYAHPESSVSLLKQIPFWKINVSRTPARFTQADVARAIRAARQAGVGAVELLPDGTIRICLDGAGKPTQPLEPDREVVL